MLGQHNNNVIHFHIFTNNDSQQIIIPTYHGFSEIFEFLCACTAVFNLWSFLLTTEQIVGWYKQAAAGSVGISLTMNFVDISLIIRQEFYSVKPTFLLLAKIVYCGLNCPTKKSINLSLPKIVCSVKLDLGIFCSRPGWEGGSARQQLLALSCERWHRRRRLSSLSWQSRQVGS